MRKEALTLERTEAQGEGRSGGAGGDILVDWGGEGDKQLGRGRLGGG